VTKLLVVGLPIGWALPNYRGVDRPGPPPPEDSDRETPAARAFAWFIQEVDQHGSIRDLEQARRLVAAYGALTPPVPLQVIEVTSVMETPGDGVVLGYDIAAGAFSLLSWGLDLGRPTRVPLAPDDLDYPLQPLLRVVGVHYRESLNAVVLFDHPDVALECLETLMAAQRIHPGLWEDESEMFGVLRVVALVNPDL